MNAKRLDHFEHLLLKERARVLAVLDDTKSEDAVFAREEASLREIDEALRLIYESPHDYGVCVQCGRPIPDQRLELIPSARFCGRAIAGSQDRRIDTAVF